MAAEIGVLGAVAFIGLLGWLFLRLFTSASRMAQRDHLLMAGVTAGLLAFALQAAIDTNFYALRQATLYWVLMGLTVGWREQYG